MNEKNKELYKQTQEKEEETLQKIKESYQDANNFIKKEVARYSDKGELSNTEMHKYKRYENLTRSIANELKNIEHLKQKGLYDYVYDQYSENFYYNGFIFETEYGKPLNYLKLAKAEIKASIENDLAKLSLKDNAFAVRSKVQKALTQSIVLGLNIDEAGELIKTALETNANNVYRIYRTETTRISNKALIDSIRHANKYGLNLKKKWFATLDDRTRGSHGDVDGEIKEVEEEFSNGLLYPGDPQGGASEVINCRCTMLEILPGYENSIEHRVERDDEDNIKEILFTTYNEWKKGRLENKEPLVKTVVDAAKTTATEKYVYKEVENINLSDDNINEEVKKEIENLPKNISKGQQNKHKKDSNEYKQYVKKIKDKGKYGPSYLTIEDDMINDLISKYSGLGEFDYNKKGNWRNKELIINNDKIVGYAVNQETGKEVETSVFNIHYGKRGVHIVPTYPSKKNNKR